MIQEDLSPLIAERRRNTQKHRTAVLNFRGNKSDQGLPDKGARRVDNVELESDLRKVGRNSLALSSNNVDENSAPVGTPIIVEVLHPPPAAIPSFANRRARFIYSAPHTFGTVVAQNCGQLFQFRHIDFWSLAANGAATAFPARYQMIVGALILIHSGITIPCAGR